MKKASKIWMDGVLVDWDQAQIHVLSHVIHYGSGVFEGIRLYQLDEKHHPGGKSAIFRLSDHVARMLDSAKIYEMVPDFSKKAIEDAILEVVRVNQLENAYIRPLIYRGYGSIGLDPTHCPVKVMVAAFEFGTYMGEEGIQNGISVCISSWNRPAVNTIPSLSKACGNYLNSQLIRLEAKEKGYAEGISLDINGFLAEGSGENVFIVKEGILYTSPFGDSILPGITRHTIIQIAKEHGLKIKEMRIPREFLYLADEVFLVGTAAEVTPVIKVDQYRIGNGNRGKITELLQTDYFSNVQGRKTDKHNWLTIV